MAAAVYLVGTDVPIWIALDPDRFMAMLDDAHANQRSGEVPADLVWLTVTSITSVDEDGDPLYEERTSYIHLDQVSLVTPLSPGERARLTEARTGVA